MKFVVDDGGELRNSATPKIVSRAIEELGKLKDGKLLTTRGITDRLGVLAATLRSLGGHPALAPFKFKQAGTAYYGNPKTIKAAREQFA